LTKPQDQERQQRTYHPKLQPNYANESHGDMVAGTYTGDTASHKKEDKNYVRDDFRAEAGTAFLVRLRRTSDFQKLDGQSGVSSHGPTLPLLFGRGSTMHQKPGEEYSVRHHGFTVRATAIADARPALSVGRPQPDVPLPVVAPVGLTLADWNLQDFDKKRPLDFSTVAPVVGLRTAAVPAQLNLEPYAEQVAAGVTRFDGYLPLLARTATNANGSPVDLGAEAVVAFVPVEFTIKGNDVTLKKPAAPTRVAAANASAALVPADGTADPWANVLIEQMDNLLAINATIPDRLLAPQLVR
jgi:hypothetical protein